MIWNFYLKLGLCMKYGIEYICIWIYIYSNGDAWGFDISVTGYFVLDTQICGVNCGLIATNRISGRSCIQGRIYQINISCRSQALFSFNTKHQNWILCQHFHSNLIILLRFNLAVSSRLIAAWETQNLQSQFGNQRESNAGSYYAESTLVCTATMYQSLN